MQVNVCSKANTIASMLLFGGTLAMSSFADATPMVRCPAEIQPTSLKANTPSEWVPFAALPLRLHTAGMSAGPPESLLRLRGDAVNGDLKAYSTSYALGGSGFEEGKWLDCFYGEAGEISISRRLDDWLTLCMITLFELKAEKVRRIEIECR